MSQIPVHAVRLVSRCSGVESGGNAYATILVSVHEKEYTPAYAWILYRAYGSSTKSAEKYLMQCFTDQGEALRSFPCGYPDRPWEAQNAWLAEVAFDEDPTVMQRTYYRKIPDWLFGQERTLVTHRPSLSPEEPIVWHFPDFTKEESRMLEELDIVVHAACRVAMDERAQELSEEGKQEHILVFSSPEPFAITEEALTRVWLLEARSTVAQDYRSARYFDPGDTLFLVYVEYTAMREEFRKKHVLYAWRDGFPRAARKQLIKGVRAWARTHGFNSSFKHFGLILRSVHRSS